MKTTCLGSSLLYVRSPGSRACALFVLFLSDAFLLHVRVRMRVREKGGASDVSDAVVLGGLID